MWVSVSVLYKSTLCITSHYFGLPINYPYVTATIPYTTCTANPLSRNRISLYTPDRSISSSGCLTVGGLSVPVVKPRAVTELQWTSNASDSVALSWSWTSPSAHEQPFYRVVLTSQWDTENAVGLSTTLFNRRRRGERLR